MAAVNDPPCEQQPKLLPSSPMGPPPSKYQSIDLSLPLARTTCLYPQFGAFAVFTLDPVASLDALEDPVALDAARALAPSCKKYIGYVKGVLDLPMRDRKYHKCDCHILSRGLAIPSPTRHIDENMCTPVAPATHPQGRPAVAPIPALPLPWDDLFIHYNAFFTFRIKTDHHETDLSHSPMLSMADLFAVGRHKSEDGERQDTLFEEEWLRSRQTEALHDAFVIAEHPRDQFMPVVSYDFDLAAVTEFAGARELYEETLELERPNPSSANWRPCSVLTRSGKRESTCRNHQWLVLRPVPLRPRQSLHHTFRADRQVSERKQGCSYGHSCHMYV
ncbi:hypothetical protein FA95DRAFT_1036504 [Auriscalpium vulgare]|uniref:Uncharacterized protein n=1 Tax=Auriscalpium vulgare TaxID=40419 RepID=A0ACB8R5E8_9AGAM|nr:hypothetical protein FA95DRAFT_1036504 [Auriscalpium vulgare]